MSQEFTDPQMIKNFVKKLGVEFEMFNTILVNGDREKRHPVFKYLMKYTSSEDITWNFSTAFVVGKDGCVKARINKPQTDDWKDVKALIETSMKEELTSDGKVDIKTDARFVGR